MPRDPDTLSDLLIAIRPGDDEKSLSVRDILERVGHRSFLPVILVPALILVSPLSAIPGAPTIGMILIVSVTAQGLVGRRHLWLPEFVMRRRIGAPRMRTALDWLAPPVGWVDRRARNRLTVLTRRPMDRVVFLLILCVALPWPVLEPVPMATSIGAFAVALLAVGLMLRDGLIVVLGIGFVGGLIAGLLALGQELI